MPVLIYRLMRDSFCLIDARFILLDVSCQHQHLSLCCLHALVYDLAAHACICNLGCSVYMAGSNISYRNLSMQVPVYKHLIITAVKRMASRQPRIGDGNVGRVSVAAAVLLLLVSSQGWGTACNISACICQAGRTYCTGQASQSPCGLQLYHHVRLQVMVNK